MDLEMSCWILPDSLRGTFSESHDPLDHVRSEESALVRESSLLRENIRLPRHAGINRRRGAGVPSQLLRFATSPEDLAEPHLQHPRRFPPCVRRHVAGCLLVRGRWTRWCGIIRTCPITCLSRLSGSRLVVRCKAPAFPLRDDMPEASLTVDAACKSQSEFDLVRPL